MKHLFILITLLECGFIYGQTPVNINTVNGQTINLDDYGGEIILYDSGGECCNYDNNEDFEVEICTPIIGVECPDNPPIVIEFLSFNIEGDSIGTCNYDKLEINGEVYCNNYLPPNWQLPGHPSYIIDDDGCVHIKFHSDQYVAYSGFALKIYPYYLAAYEEKNELLTCNSQYSSDIEYEPCILCYSEYECNGSQLSGYDGGEELWHIDGSLTGNVIITVDGDVDFWVYSSTFISIPGCPPPIILQGCATGDQNSVIINMDNISGPAWVIVDTKSSYSPYTISLSCKTCYFECPAANVFDIEVCKNECFQLDPNYLYIWNMPPPIAGNCTWESNTNIPSDGKMCPGTTYWKCYYLTEPILTKGENAQPPPYIDTCCYYINIIEKTPDITCPGTISRSKCAGEPCIYLEQDDFPPVFYPAGCGYYYQVAGWPANNCFSAASTPIIYDLYDSGGNKVSSCTTYVNVITTTIALTFSTTPANCAQSNGSAMVMANGGAPPYLYEWSNGATGNKISNVSAGHYGVTVTDANGCISSGDENVPGTGSVEFSLMPTAASCEKPNGRIRINVTMGKPPYSYAWTGGTGGTFDDSSYDINNVSAGPYTVTVTDANGCIAIRTVTVGGSPAIEDVTLLADPSACAPRDGRVTISMISGGTYGLNVWLDGNLNGSLPDLSNLPYTIEGLSPKAYTVRLVDARGCDYSRQVTVGERPRPTALSLMTSSAKCDPPSSGSVHAIVSGGTPPYDYTLGATTIPDVTDYTFASLVKGSYTVRAVDRYGCDIQNTVMVEEVKRPSGLAIEAIDPGCTNDDGILIAGFTGGTAPYRLSVNGVSTAESGRDTIAVQFLAGGHYAILIRDDNGCEISGDALLRTKRVPVTGIRDIMQPACFFGLKGNVNVDIDSNALYSVDGIHFQASNFFEGLPPGEYMAVAQDKTSGCYSDTVPFTIHPLVVTFKAIADTVKFDFYSNPIAFDVMKNDNFGDFSPSSFSVQPVEAVVYNPDLEPIGTVVVRRASEFEFYYQGSYDSHTKKYKINDPFDSQVIPYELITEECPVIRDTGQIILRSSYECFDNYNDYANTITPNGDGHNDVLVLPVFEKCKVTRIEFGVYSRYGEKVFENSYNNEPYEGTTWDGVNRKGEKLPAGTYYYVMRLRTMDGKEHVIKNFVEILRSPGQ